jgi:hypothetical protein
MERRTGHEGTRSGEVGIGQRLQSSPAVHLAGCSAVSVSWRIDLDHLWVRGAAPPPKIDRNGNHGGHAGTRPPSLIPFPTGWQSSIMMLLNLSLPRGGVVPRTRLFLCPDQGAWLAFLARLDDNICGRPRYSGFPGCKPTKVVVGVLQHPPEQRSGTSPFLISCEGNHMTDEGQTASPVAEWLTGSQVAEWLQVSLDQVGRMTKADILPVYRLTRKCLRYRKDDILAYLQSKNTIAQGDEK